MDHAELRELLHGTEIPNQKTPTFTVPCPCDGCAGTLSAKRFKRESESYNCSLGCSKDKIEAAVSASALQRQQLKSNGAGGGEPHKPADRPIPSQNGHSNGKVHRPEVNLESWKLALIHFVMPDVIKARGTGIERGVMLEDLILMMQRGTAKIPLLRPPDLSATRIEEEIYGTAERIVADEFNIPEDEVPPMEEERSVVIWEDHAAAVIANAEYLQRSEIVERLFYSSSISLGVGGKHQGKTTNSRTLAMSVMRGEPIWDRKTAQGHVIYAASDDEVATTRMQLLAMGWKEGSDPLSLVRIRPDAAADPDRVLAELAVGAQKLNAILIILDMLFDFARIKDEMSYAGTREAIGKIQTLADLTKAHVHSTHHSPKYMTDVATAATAALGSQGIAARFSPIILTRKFGDDLFTIESTMTRDPRGLALPQTCIGMDDRGWAVSKGPFKNWMKWRMYSGRIMAMFEGQEADTELTVIQVAQALELPRPEVQNCLYHLFLDDGVLDRRKTGRSIKYRLKVQETFDSDLPKD